ncbi:ribonuclease H-like domain-containing protein, partial [Tanacetum coccineum]
NGPTQCLNLHVSSISPLPKSSSDAFNYPNWQNAMSNEYNALIKNDTWILVPRPTDANIILERAHKNSCNSSQTSVDTKSKLGDDGDSVSDLTLYRSLEVSLRYLPFTRPDISYAVQQVCLYMHDPQEPHFLALKRILRYVRGTLDYGLQLFSSSTTSLVAYSDAELVALLLIDRLHAIVYFSATTYSHGPLNVNRRFLVLVQK